MADWRKAKNYVFPPDFPDYLWAWEFLRRNPDYRNDWQAAVSGIDAAEDLDDPGFFVHSEEGAAKWSLIPGLLNPATDHPRFGFSVSFGSIRFFSGEGVFPVKARGSWYPWVEFDLHWPLTHQLEAARLQLDQAQRNRNVRPHRVVHHRPKWPHYLRLLDADLDDRTPVQIAAVLQGEINGIDEKKIWDQLEAARKMTRPEGYMTIFLSPSPSDSSPPE